MSHFQTFLSFPLCCIIRARVYPGEEDADRDGRDLIEWRHCSAAGLLTVVCMNNYGGCLSTGCSSLAIRPAEKQSITPQDSDLSFRNFKICCISDTFTFRLTAHSYCHQLLGLFGVRSYVKVNIIVNVILALCLQKTSN